MEQFEPITELEGPRAPVINNLIDTQGIPNPAMKLSNNIEDWMLYVPSVGYLPKLGLPLLFPPEDYEAYLAR